MSEERGQAAHVAELEHELKLLREEVGQSERVKLLLQRSTEQLKHARQQQIFLQQELEHRLRELERAKTAAEAASQAKTRFLSSMSHELRTPMNAILGFSQLLENDVEPPLTAEQRECVGEILKAGRYLLGLIDEVLDLASMESGHISVSLEPVVLSTLVEEALEPIRPLATEHDIRLTVPPVNGDLYVLADRVRLLQVLLHLLANAVKYNRNGGEVCLETAQRGKGRLEISVIDTGPGLTPEQQIKVFEPFASYNKIGGIPSKGMGLAISRRLIHAMGGEMELDSVSGSGSRFRIVLPSTGQHMAHEMNGTVATGRAGENRP